MRRWFLVLLLFVLPMQMAFAGTAICGQDAAQAGVQNLLQAHGIAADANTVDATAQTDEAGGTGTPFSHCECGVCHPTGAQPAADLAVRMPALQKQRLIAQPARGMLPDVTGCIDRPNWTRAA